MSLIKLTDYTLLREALKENPDLSEDEKDCITEGLRDLSNSSNKVLVFPDFDFEDKGFSVVKWDGNDYWTQQYVGFLKIDNQNIFIRSRFDSKVNGLEEYYFTPYILSRALGMGASIFQDMRLEAGPESIFQQMLAIIFFYQIDKAFRKGIYRRYRTYENNDSKVKGKLDIARHIRQNPPALNNGKIAYSYREYTIDNNLNRLILTSYCFLEKKYSNLTHILLRENKNVANYIRQLRNVMCPASRQEAQSLLYKERKKIVHSVYRDWEPVRQTAVWILRHLGLNAADKNDSGEMNGILINMSWVWEKYISSILQENSTELNSFKIKCQVEKKILFDSSDRNKRTLKPDVIVQDTRNEKLPDEKKPILMIIDAKYKNHWYNISSSESNKTDVFSMYENAGDWEHVRDDVFQILAYMHVFECKKVGIACPAGAAFVSSQKSVYGVAKPGDTDKFFVFPVLIVSNAESQEEFSNNMQKNEERFRKEVLSEIL